MEYNSLSQEDKDDASTVLASTDYHDDLKTNAKTSNFAEIKKILAEITGAVVSVSLASWAHKHFSR